MAADAEQKPGGEGAGAGAGAGSADAGQQGAGGQGADAGQQKPAAGEDVQKAINAVVARERAAAEAREKELQRQLDELRGQVKPPKPADEDAAFRSKVEEARKPLEAELEKERTARQALNSRLTRSELKGAATDSVDAEHVADLLEKQVRVTETGDFEVVDRDGKPRYGATGPMSVGELVAELLAQKPYLAKSTARSGADYRGTTPKPAGDLDAQIAEAEKAGNFVLAGNLKAQKLERLMQPAKG